MVEYHVHVRSTDQFKQVGVGEKNDRNDINSGGSPRLTVHLRNHLLITCKMIGYWSRLILGKPEKLSFKAYQMLLYHFNDDDYKNNWIMTIKCILDDVGLSYIWNNQLCNNTKWIVEKLRIPYEISICKIGMQISMYLQKV